MIGKCVFNDLTSHPNGLKVSTNEYFQIINYYFKKSEYLLQDDNFIFVTAYLKL